jgi:crossover junction endodeoxyribonuclease RuvC
VRILGIDPGSHATGFGVIERRGTQAVLLVCGTIEGGRGGLSERLAIIHRRVAAVIAEWSPEVACAESLFIARNARAALTLGQARGAALAACGLAGLALYEYAPAAVKLAVAGHGRADKEQVQRMVRLSLGLAQAPQSDAADAVAVALCHAYRAPLAEAIARASAPRAPHA